MIVAVVAAVLTATDTFSIDGTIATVNVDVDKSAVSFGMMARGDTKTDTITVSNNGNVDMTLSLTTDAPAYITVTWDVEDYVLAVGSNVLATISLTVAADTPNDVTSFTIAATVTGTA